MKKDIKLIIFDFDGTLADTYELIIRTNQAAMEAMNYPVRDEETIRATIGLPLEAGIRTLFPDLPEEAIPQWCATYRRIFDVYKTQYLPVLFPEVKETLEWLRDKGFVLTVASSRQSESLNTFLRNLGILPCFRYVLGADNVAKAKPDPEPVLQTLRDLGYSAEQTLVVGDMPVDVFMGARAGAKTVGVTYGNSNRAQLLEAGADFVLDRFSGLKDLFV
ncbi:MAG: HAD-IA family hydrolase [Bacteroidales bacterium]|nr:HAD-IA family hydrolase [Bacteroidales bacterium]